MPHASVWISSLLGTVLGSVIYMNTLSAGFTYDDKVAVLSNPDVIDARATPWADLWKHDFWGNPIIPEGNYSWTHNSYRPLTVLTLRVDALRGETAADPAAYHVTNVLIHAVLCALFPFAVAPLIFRDLQNDENAPTAGEEKSAQLMLASAAFALHPIHTEVVGNVTSRAEPLSAVFLFLALICFQVSCRCAQRSDANQHLGWDTFQSWLWVLLAHSAIVLGVLCKETALVGPALMIGWEVAWNRQPVRSSAATVPFSTDIRWLLCGCEDGSSRGSLASVGRIRWKRVIFLGTLAVLMYVGRVHGLTGGYRLDAPDVHNPLGALADSVQRFMSLAFVQSFAMSLLVFPWHLSHEHNALQPIVSLMDARNLVSVMVWIAALALLWTAIFSQACARDLARRWRILFFLGWIVVSYLPASHVFLRVGFVLAERQLLLPSVGIALLLSEVARAGLDPPLPSHNQTADEKPVVPPTTMGRMAVFVVALATLAAWGCRTWKRNWDWANDRGILESCVQMYPEHNFMGWYGLGAVDLYDRNLASAEHYLLLAIDEEPRIAEPRILLSQLYLQYPAFAGPSSHHRGLHHLAKIIDMYSIRREMWSNYGYLLLLLLHSPPFPRNRLEPSLPEAVASLPHLRYGAAGQLFPNSTVLASDEERWHEAEYFIIAGAKGSTLPARHKTRGILHSNAACMRLLSPPGRFGNYQQAINEAKAAARIVHPSVHVAAHNLAMIQAVNGDIQPAISYLRKSHELAAETGKKRWLQQLVATTYKRELATLESDEFRRTAGWSRGSGVGEEAHKRLNAFGMECTLQFTSL